MLLEVLNTARTVQVITAVFILSLSIFVFILSIYLFYLDMIIRTYAEYICIRFVDESYTEEKIVVAMTKYI